MNWSKVIRQVHRWVSIAFIATVLANFVVMARGEPPAWVTYSPLLPLAVLLLTGLYMFVPWGVLEPAYKDGLTRGGSGIDVGRDAKRRIAGLVVESGRVCHLRFTRVR